MPIYEYECRKCGERFEVLQRINEDNSRIRCPRCNADAPQRVLSSFSSGSVRSSASCSTGST
ncbi:MAG: FmdB family zinc ribbon protein [Thermodesulfobacteriota bacterium]